MGKAIKTTNSPTYAFMNKGVIKKTTKIHRKLDMINNYLRTLSNNFGEIETKENYRRKRKVDNTDEAGIPECKKQKFCRKEPTKLKSYDMECLHKATSDTTFGRKLTHLQPVVGMKDLFYMDEAKSSSEITFHTDWMFHLYDEISLEGLDGITPEALWTRLRSLFSYPLLLEGKKEMIWNLCKYISQLDYHILNKPRGKLVIYDRNHFLCPNTGIVLEPLVTNEIYPYSMVNTDGVRGSCSTYHTRDKYTMEMKGLSLLEVSNMFGNRLVIVASQKMRENAIMNEIANPCLELVDNEYSLLERVGRSRRHGETTQGRVSILNLFKDSRSVFHIRKTLEKKKLLKKQFFVIRNLNASQNKTGKLLHLRRFYRKQKSKTLLLIEEVVELLRQKPGYSLEFGEFKKYFPRKTGVHKVMKTAEFNKYIRTDIFRPYRYLYPNATAAEWKYKNREKEKVLRIFQLIDPTANVLAAWDAAESEHNSDEECNDDETGDVKLVGTDFLKEIFLTLFNSGKEGLTLQELEKKVDFDYYTVRMAVRKLQAKNVIDSLRSEQGKQRHLSYFARCFHSDIPRTLQNSTPMGIPPQILQKIIQPQENVTSTRLIADPDLSFIANKSVVRFSTNLPFQCDALIRHVRSPSVEIRKLENLWKFIVFSKSKSELGLSCEPVAVKYFEAIKRRVRRRWNFAKCDDMIISYSWEDYVVKILFLKHMDGQDALSILEMLGGNETENAQIPDLGLIADPRRFMCQKAHSYSRDHLLGPSPTVVYQETTPAENINVTIVLSTTPKKYIYEYSSYVTFDKNVTPLSVFRTNTILDLVNQSNILCDLHKMQRCVVAEMESSVSSRTQGKIDRNTLDRLLLKLSNEGYLKIFKVMLSNDEKIKTHWLVTHPRIVINNQLMQTTIEQLLMRFFIVTEHKSPKQTVSSSLKELKPVGTGSLSAFKINKSFGTILGYQPKFVRIQLLHELLFYLLYDYKPLEKMKHDDIEDVLPHFSKEEARELPPIYRKGIDWRMFIPPLPHYKEWPNGWVLFCDVLLATPLSLWVKLFHVSLEYPPLLTYMEHPVKRHFLVKDVSAEFRQVLMFKRKYLYSAVQTLYRLCFIGLAQVGPQNPNVKDHIFVYLNKKTKLLDTATSSASYHKITPKKYREIPFSFESKEDVDDYWCQLWTISMKTPLGQRTVMEGKSVTIENPAYKESLLESLTAKTPTEAVLCDTGDVPGDNLGAAGLDSSMWAHVKKNWLLSSKAVKNKLAKKEDENIRNANIACIKPISIKYKELVNQNRKIYLPNESLKIQDNEPVVDPHRNKTTTLHFRRKFVAKPKILARQKRDLDPKDKMIRKKNGALFRAIWTSKEDRVLYLLKAAMIFLSLNSAKELVPLYVVRDLLHLISPESRNKTTNAIAARILKLSKSDPVMKRIKEKPTDLINFKLISEYFSPIIFEMNKSSKFHYDTSELIVAYIHLMFLMLKHSEDVNEILRGNRVSLDYFAPNNIHIFSPILVASEKNKSEYSNPVTVEAVKKDVIRSVLLSYLNGAKVGQNASYQLFCIYKKFSDNVIRSVVKSMKDEQTISLVKKIKSPNSPITTMPFVLSVSYTHMQKSTFSNITVHAIYQNYLDTIGELGKFYEHYPSEAVFVYGRLIARNEIASIFPNINYAFKIPESTYILNPYIQDRSFLTAKLAPLYQKYLKQKLEEKEKTKHVTRETINNAPKAPPKPTISSNEKQLERIRSRVTNLLMTLPCFCNKTINENFTKFVKTEDETQFTDYLSVFLKVLISITMNLLNTQEDPVLLCRTYMQRFCRNNIVDTVPKQLEAQIFKICYVIREFLKNHEFTDIKTCFESEDENAGNPRCEEILGAWLKKSKIVRSKANAESRLDNSVWDPNVHRTFFRKNKRKSAAVSSDPLDNHVENSERIPEIPEIVKEMMIPPEVTERSVPHVSQLACLLSSYNFPELHEDENVLEELRSHFIAQYPILEKFIVNREELKSLTVFRNLFNSGKKLKLEDQIDRKFRIGPPNHGSMTESIVKMGGQAVDLRLAEDIITYVFNKGELGATGQQLKVYANQRGKTLDLIDIINLLIEHYIILRVGISEILFVHYAFKNWLVETFRLLPHENHLLEMYKKEQMKNLKEKIETKMKSTRRVNVLLMPWVRIDGTLNVPLLDKWLTIVLSYCLDYPLCPLPRLCEKFFLVKPVELFFLLETLQDLGCLEILVTVKPTVNIFSFREQDVISRVATCLDSFNDMYVKVHNLSTLCMGFYLDRESLEFA